MYEFNADFNPLANTTIGNIASFIAIESIQYGVIEGDSLLTGVLIGSYAGFAFEYLVDTADDYIYTPAYNYFFS